MAGKCNSSDVLYVIQLGGVDAIGIISGFGSTFYALGTKHFACVFVTWFCGDLAGTNDSAQFACGSGNIDLCGVVNFDLLVTTTTDF